jgi:hypothetical protein
MTSLIPPAAAADNRPREQPTEKNPMSHTENRLRPGDDGIRPGEGSGLLSARSLIIVALSIIIGVLVGLSAGLTAGINLAHRAGPGWALAAGLIAGLAAAAMSGLAVAGALHAIVTKRSALAAPAGYPARGNTIFGDCQPRWLQEPPMKVATHIPSNI